MPPSVDLPARAGGAPYLAPALRAAAWPWRRHVTWSVDLDLPVGLVTRTDAGAALQVILEDPAPGAFHGPGAGAGIAAGWLVLVSVMNAGLAPVRNGDFSAPLGFAFPGREVCAAQVTPAPPRQRHRHRLPVLPVPCPRPGGPGGARACAVQLGGRVELNRHDAFNLMVVLRGLPAGAGLRVQQEGMLADGKISAGHPDEPTGGWWRLA